MTSWPPLKIGHLEMNLIQGGMGVGISGEKLASAVAEEGGAGIIASVGLGLSKGYFQDALESAQKRGDFNDLNGGERRKLLDEIYAGANSDALRDEIIKARSKTNGVIGVNIMQALTDYPSLIKTAVAENVDLIICGAKIIRDLPKYIRGKKNPPLLVPIASNERVAGFFVDTWSNLGHKPDAIVFEGPKAGGHLGYDEKQLADPDFVSNGLERILPEIINVVGPDIPVIAAGGIYTGQDIYNILKLGAAGVQMATRFVTTHECDAHDRFKQAYIDAKPKDIVIIKSPVGMPGRAIKNKFVEDTYREKKRIPFACQYKCLIPCSPTESNYCIANALINAQRGNMEQGFAFCGTNAWRATEIVSVKDVFNSLEREYNEACKA